MTTITLEISDELAARLAPLKERLPSLLSLAVDLLPTPESLASSSVEIAHPAFNEMIDFLAGGPTPEQIVAFKSSTPTQARLEELLEKNAQDGLTNVESSELNTFEQINHILNLLKARARITLALN
jgi:hypothetical protein